MLFTAGVLALWEEKDALKMSDIVGRVLDGAQEQDSLVSDPESDT